MQWSDIRFSPSDRLVRQFAAAGVLALVAAAARLAPRHPGWASAALGTALALGLAGWLRPRVVRPLYLGAMVAAFPIGWLTSWVMLGAVYYGLFTPLAVAFRLLGRDPLARRGPAPGGSYWRPKPPPGDPSRYLRQY
ncbi:MAG: hypothetical protein NVSMB9_08280 [Isosphaeraceae bacterium]